MKRTKSIFYSLIVLFVMLVSLQCNAKNEHSNFNLAGRWISEEYFSSKTTDNHEHVNLFFTPDGKFCPLGEVYDMHRFRHYQWTGDSLVLTNNNGMKAYFHILSYNDSLFTIVDYPEYGDTLHFEKKYGYTMEKWREKEYLSAFDFPDDSLDIILENTHQSLPDNSKAIVLSKRQMIKAYNILKKFYYGGYLEKFYDERIVVSLGYPLDFYFRRYIGYRQGGHMKVLIALNNKLNRKYDYVKTYSDIRNSNIAGWSDGGPGIGAVYIDLDENKVEWLNIHGSA